MRYIYTFWLWLKNVFFSTIETFVSLIYYFSFLAVIIKSLLFGAYAVIPILRKKKKKSRTLEFIIGRKLLDDIDENDITLRAVFKYFLLPYAVWLFIVIVIKHFAFGG